MLIKKQKFSDLVTDLGVEEEDFLEESPKDTIHRALESHNLTHSLAPDKDAIMQEIQEEGEEIIRRSQEEAERIIQSAEEQVRERLDSAVKEKFKSLEDLEKKALNEIESILNSKKEAVHESQGLIIDLATELASKIINRRVREDSSILTSTLKEIIDGMLLNPEESLKLNIVVNPKDAQIAQKFADDLQNKSTGNTECNVKSDDSIAEGSCIVETPNGSMDLNFSTQLQIFKERMKAESSDQNS
ncbi:MAG: FliH/SctL family protein [Candidatus Caenarcaniphilales bacterium]|nr:FliH/SctL family protein [Candidatus Caenarcaniphilales bacterium]